MQAPQPITSEHDLSDFQSDNAELNDWLKEQALKSEGLSARTYVLVTEGKVIGYYCLATATVARTVAIGSVKRNSPDPIPCMLIGRLAVDLRWEKRGIGSGLLRDALLRIFNVAQVVGVKAVLVHAKDENAKSFYLKRGFQESPIESFTLMLPVKDIQANLK